MQEGGFQFAVIGSTPLALMLAGLLAERHRRKVCLVAESHVAYRLPRGMDLSVGFVTRPQTWTLLRALTAETTRLISQVAGKGAYERVDPALLAETAFGRDALGHARHVALASGYEVEQLHGFPGLDDAAGIRFRDAVSVDRPVFDIGVWDWLASAGVVRVSSLEARGEITVLADDIAALEHGSRLLHPVPSASILSAPVAPLPAASLLFLERGAALHQGRNRAVSAVFGAPVDAAAGHLGAILGSGARLAGRSGFVAARTPDGAPMIGLSAPGMFTIAGLGCIGAFLAPAIARFLAGEASAEEARWIEAHAPLADRSLVAEVSW